MSLIMTILYEDQMGLEISNFGMHNILLHCVCDEISEANLWKLKKIIHCNPKKGDSGVIRALMNDGKILLNSGGVIALLDNDRIREPLNMQSIKCKKKVADKLREFAPGCDAVLLVENTETVCRVCANLLCITIGQKKPTPMERDEILNRAAFNLDINGRKNLRIAVPSFDRLVVKVSEWYKSIS